MNIFGTIAQVGAIGAAIAMSIGMKGGSTVATRVTDVLKDIEDWKEKV